MLTDEEKAMIDSYSEVESDGLTLAQSLDALEEIDDIHQAILEDDKQALENVEVQTFLKYRHFETEISSDETETFNYDGIAYELEVYQGQDCVLTINGVNSQDLLPSTSF